MHFFLTQPIKRHAVAHGSVPFGDFKVVDLVTDGLQVTLLWEARQQSLDATAVLFFTFKLDKKHTKT